MNYSYTLKLNVCIWLCLYETFTTVGLISLQSALKKTAEKENEEAFVMIANAENFIALTSDEN